MGDGRALGVNRQTISNRENNRTYPDIVSVIRMSDLCSVSLDRLLKEEANTPMPDPVMLVATRSFRFPGSDGMRGEVRRSTAAQMIYGVME